MQNLYLTDMWTVLGSTGLSGLSVLWPLLLNRRYEKYRCAVEQAKEETLSRNAALSCGQASGLSAFIFKKWFILYVLNFQTFCGGILL